MIKNAEICGYKDEIVVLEYYLPKKLSDLELENTVKTIKNSGIIKIPDLLFILDEKFENKYDKKKAINFFKN